ncbi:DNA (cytosine-5)-methyltransferase 1 [Paenibacillus catalpae]|uniref:DNA (cytosine-5-)-methyltransferase n=1 Tax=Paenibacillus catalpae TaxID=1045775 RepID=A0A1I2E2L2_9BACL|nr:DNA cytosine methyltransferase [Paenibacillus catalpae]SFE86929.1 DNA (cytosine-5)-methyltransferase 1 [Paenibacillus catalpae]
MDKLKIIDLFSGAGGLSSGFEQTGRFEVIGAVELNPAAAETYIKNHGNNPNIIIKAEGSIQSNITEIKFKEFIDNKRVDSSKLVVIGGPPCQGFSNANRQKNYLISGNNQLVKEFVRAIDEMRPKAFLMENVKAIESVKHKFFVTQHKKDKDYSSENHLREITAMNSKYSIDKPIWKDDLITLLDSEFNSLQTAIKYIVQKKYDTPIIDDERLVSRLRVIEKEYIQKSRAKSKSKSPKSVAEIKELVNHLAGQIDQMLINNDDLGIAPVIIQALPSLQKLIDGELDLQNAKNTIGPLIDINTLLIHLRELKDEGIVNTLKVDMKSPLKVYASVKSYNVVEYLRCVFEYFDYDIDSGPITASDFGVPQKRSRFIMIGTYKARYKPELPIRKLKRLFYTRDAISDLASVPPEADMKKYKALDYPDFPIDNPLQKYFRKGSEKLHNHINTASNSLSLKRFEEIRESGGKNFHSLSDEMKDTYTDASRTQTTIYLRLNYDDHSPTVVNIRKSMWNHPENAVSLSVREAARLQSFKDKHIFCGTKDQQYQQVGNAVPPLMARAIAESLLKSLGIEPETPLDKELQELVVYENEEALV